MKMVIEREIYKKKYIKMVLYIQEKLKIKNDQVKVHMYIKIMINMQVIGMKMYLKEWVFINLIMEIIIMEIY